MSATRRVTPVILSGGTGTRLWPLSREGRPKQLIALAGDRTMLQCTALRAADPDLFLPPLVVAGGAHGDAIEAQLAEAGVAPARLILEPCGRSTAPAIALAALNAAPDALLLVMPSDHVVTDARAFRAALEAVLPLAEEGWLVTFGVRPERAETGYGYIARGEAIGADGALRARAFVEKPSRDAAEVLLAGGDHFWNAGIFLFRADAYIGALERHAPYILPPVRAAVAAQRSEGARVHPEPQSFARAPSQSIDHAVMERSGRVAVIPVEMGWSDAGSWDALHGLGEKDPADNVLAGDVVAIDSRGCLVRSDGPVVVTLGVEDLVVVATERAVLIVPRGQGDRVKEAVDALRRRGRKPPAQPTTETRDDAA